MAESISIREFSRREGVSDTLVHKALKRGRLTRLADGGLDAALVGTPWFPRRRERRSEKAAADKGLQTEAESLQTGNPAKGISIAEALRLKETYIAGLRRLEYQEKSGGLCQVARLVG